MHEMQTIVTNDRCLSVSLSLLRGSTQPHCAKTAVQIKMLFEVNIPGGPRNIVLAGGPDPHTERWRGEKILPSGDPLHISGTAEARDLKFCVHTDGSGPNKKVQK